jgi:hypothetical protein
MFHQFIELITIQLCENGAANLVLIMPSNISASWLDFNEKWKLVKLVRAGKPVNKLNH